MSINNKYTPFEKLLQEKMNNFEYPYNHKDWMELEKELPSSSKPVLPKNTFYTYFAGAAVIIGAIALIYFLNQNENSSNNLTQNSPFKTNKNTAIQENSTSTTSNNGSITNGKNNQVPSNNNLLNSPSLENEKNNTVKENSENNNIIEKDNKSNAEKNNNELINNEIKATKPTSNSFSKELIFASITEGCAPLKVDFNPLLIADTIKYLWNFGDKKTSTLKTPSHNYTKAGTYTVTLTVTYEKSKQTKNITLAKNITIYAEPKAGFEYTTSEDGYDYTFTNTSSNTQQWTWSFGDKTTSTEKNPIHTYKQKGSYKVQLTETNTNGCTSTISKIIPVSFKQPFNIPSGFVINGVSGAYGPIGENMNPNGYTMSIYDNSGKLVFETTDLDIKWEGTIKGTNEEAKTGVYFWKISMKDRFNNLNDYSGHVTVIKN